MSQENVEIVRRAISHLSETGEPDWELYDPDVVWTTRMDGPAHNIYRGIDGLRRGTESLREVWAEINAEILEVIDGGDTIVSVLRWRLRAQSGVELETVEGWVTGMRDGRISRIEQHAGKREALEAAGLSEQDAHPES
jgi:ketosteroid isomerase-like protein